MGTYTDPEKFYLIDPSELVEVENDLNYNLKRADEHIKALVEYQVTDVSSISNTGSINKEQGFRWYKTYSNSIWNYHYAGNGTDGIFQDPNSQVESWSGNVGTFEPGYGSQDQGDNRIAYSLFNGWVQFRGNLVLNAGNDDFLTNKGVEFLTLPQNLVPNHSKFLMCSGGRSDVDFQLFRISVPGALDDGNNKLTYFKYGQNGLNNSNKYISLNSLRYPLVSEPG